MDGKKRSKKFIKDAEACGFTFVRQTGSHHILVKPKCNPISVPTDLNVLIDQRLRKANHITVAC